MTMRQEKSTVDRTREKSAVQSETAMGRRRSRILFVSHSGNLYGAERSLLTLLKGLKAADKYEILTYLPHEGDFSRVLAEENINFRIFPYSRWIGLRLHAAARYLRRLRNRWYITQLLNDAEKWNPDAIYTNTLATPVGAMLTCRLVRRPFHIWHARELPGEKKHAFGLFDWGFRDSFRFIAQTSDRFICNSRFLMEKLMPFLEQEMPGISENRMHVVYNGFEQQETGGVPGTIMQKKRESGEVFRIVMAGGIGSRKNYGEAVRGISMLVGEGNAVKLDIYGSGSTSALRQLKREITAESLGDHVALMGYHQNILPVISRSDLLLITSRMETFGRVAVEAMLAGCPVVSSDAGALPEIIHDGKTGLLYRSGDPEHLARQIKKLMNDPNLGTNLAQKAADFASKEFSSDRFVAGIHRILQETLFSKKGGRPI